MANDLTGKDLKNNISEVLPKTRQVKTESSAIAANLKKAADEAAKIVKLLGGGIAKVGGVVGGKMGGPGDMQTASGGGGMRSMLSGSFGLSNFTDFASSMASGMSKFMPDIGAAMQSSANYYNASLMAGTGQTRNKLRQATFSGLAGGLTSQNSDAQVANILASSGMSANRGVYGQTVTAVGNAAKYLNMDNSKAAAAISGLTSGSMSSNLLRNFGIFTSDLATGKEKTQGQIFEEMAQRMTAGRPGATTEETLDSIRRGNLGESIANSGLSADQQDLFKQFMVARSQGVMMDLSDSASMSKLSKMQEGAGNQNPLTGMMQIQSNQTEASNSAQDQYITGIQGASVALSGLIKVSGELASVMGAVNSFGRTLLGSNQAQALADMGNASLDLITGGMSASTDLMNPTNMAMGRVGIGIGIAGAAVTAGLGVSGAITSGVTQGNNGLGGGENGNQMASGVVDLGSLSGSSIAGTNGTTGPMFDYAQVSAGHGKPNRGFGKEFNNHSGIDYNYDVGDPVKAIADGFVKVARSGHDKNTYNESADIKAKSDNTGSLGNMVVLHHTDKDGKLYSSIYGHLSKVSAIQGTQVKKGDIIGYSGNSGYSKGAHLHFELRKGGLTTGKGSMDSKSWVSPEDAAKILGTNSPTTAVDQMSSAQISQASGLYSAMAGLYSGNMETMKSSLSALMGILNPGGAGSGYTTPGNTPKSPSSGGGTAPGGSVGAPGGGSGTPPTVNINVAVSGNEDEAKKFATLVAEYLQSDTLASNLGGY
jgi:murein DD-endopeptidase MepM/ murein hydrolase activator NlpD